MQVPNYIGSVKSNNAVVSRIAKNGIHVSPNLSCNEPAGCHNCSLCGTKPSKLEFFCSIPNPYDYSEGQCIRIKYFSLTEVVAAVVVFGIPIFCAIVTYTVYSLFIAASTETLGLVLATAVAVVFGFIIVYIIEKLTRYFYPVTIEDVAY